MHLIWTIIFQISCICFEAYILFIVSVKASVFFRIKNVYNFIQDKRPILKIINVLKSKYILFTTCYECIFKYKRLYLPLEKK